MKQQKYTISYFDPTQDGTPTYTEDHYAISINQLKEKFKNMIIISIDEI